MIALISVMIVTLEQRDKFGPEGVRFRLHVVRQWIGRIAGVNRYIYSNTPCFDSSKSKIWLETPLMKAALMMSRSRRQAARPAAGPEFRSGMVS